MAGRDIAQHGNEERTMVARRRLRGRNFALLGLLVGVVVLFYVLTFVILGGQGS